MKNGLVIVLLLTTYYLLLTTTPASALTPTPTGQPTATPTQSTVGSQINQLKDRIASRVAQLKLVERRGIIGSVTEVAQTQITINDIHNNTRFIDVDELTKFSSPSAKETFGISDITKGVKVGILGLYNKQTRRTLSRFVDVISLPITVHGIVKSTDNEEYIIEVQKEDGTVIAVDVETITKTNTFDVETEATKTGFSKIKNGVKIIVVGFPAKNANNRVVASRILLFPDFSPNPTTLSPTGSGKTASKSAQ